MCTLSNASSLPSSWAERRLAPVRWWAVLSATSVFVALVAIVLSRSYISHHALDLDEPGRVSACQDEVLNRIAPHSGAVDLAVLTSIHQLCYREVAEADVLTDFGIRKSAYLNQQAETSILMWMVVAITLSGVVLAGVQLFAGYKLAASRKAAFDQGGQLDIEQSKISIRSSVTGLMILTISLAFFIVFVYKVYFIKDPGDAPVTGSGLAAQVNQPSQNRSTAAPAEQQARSAVPYFRALPGWQQPSAPPLPQPRSSTPAVQHRSYQPNRGTLPVAAPPGPNAAVAAAGLQGRGQMSRPPN